MYEGTAALTLNPPRKGTYSRPAPFSEAPAPAERERERTQTAAPPAAIARPASMRLKFRTVALFAGAMAVLLFIVYNQMELSQLSKANQTAVAELQALRREEAALNRRFDAGVSLNEVEAYAVGELGMVKPSKEQIVYIGVPSYDRAEVIRQESFWMSLRGLFANMGTRVTELFD
ncbi:MAG: hypothetical protein FWG72_00655 [Oscillospiraceae bacterium]|nr:hypothetical protein [Oscillospiraceae bacterium]